MPHQQYVADLTLQHDPQTQRFDFDETVVTIMRQCGKTSMLFSRKVWRCTMAPRLIRPATGEMWDVQRAMYTAQTRKDARKKLEKDFSPLLRTTVAKQSFQEIRNPKGRPSNPTQWKESLNNGSEQLVFGAAPHNYFQIDAPTRSAGHGDHLDEADIDEAWAHRTDEVEQAVSPTMLTRWNSQLHVYSAAGDETSFYLWGKVLAGRAEHEKRIAMEKAGELYVPSRTLYIEYSIPDDADIDDEDVWWEYIPALGRTIEVDKVRAELDRNRRNPQKGENAWRRSLGNQWPNIPILEDVDESPAKLPADKWTATAICTCDVEVCEDHMVKIEPGEITLGFAVAKSGRWSSIGLGAASMESPYVELIDHRRDVDWLPGRIVELVKGERPIKIGCNGASPAAMAMVGPIIQRLRDARLDVELLKILNQKEFVAACEGFFIDVDTVRLRRPGQGQGPLDRAATKAKERLVGKDGFVFEVDDATVPVCPVDAVVIARSLLPAERRRKVQKPIFIRT